MEYEEIISIHGAPRSGTSWLGQIFNSSPNVRYKFQPLFSYAFKDEINLKSDKEEIINYYNRLYDCKDDFLDQKDKIEKGIYPSFKKKEGNPCFLVTKMVRYHYLIPHLLEKIDNIKFIAIIRHPCGVLNSWRKAPREFSKEWNFKKEWRFAQSKNKFRPEEYFGFNRWKEVTKLFIEMEKEYSNRFKIIKYEDLVTNTLNKVEKLFQWSKLELTDQTLNFIKASTTQDNQEDVYSVYKGNKNVAKWKNELDYEIIEKVTKELEDTEFQKFIKN